MSYSQGFLQPGVLTISSSYNQGFLRSEVSYMTSLSPDVDIDRKFLRSGVFVDREFSHTVRILCSDVEIVLTISYPC